MDQLSDWYDESEIERLKWFIGQIPARDTMVHGDFHTNNIMVQGDELLIIDMADEDKKHSVEAAKAYLFPQMDAMLEELNELGEH
ncbi:MAG: phosphotransferase [Eubacterium sp.]|nr:phosphotransferase [Eubacterium sp.]